MKRGGRKDEGGGRREEEREVMEEGWRTRIMEERGRRKGRYENGDSTMKINDFE